MKLSAWARQQGLSYRTAWRLWKAGKLPVPAEQLATGTVILHATPRQRASHPVWPCTLEFPPGSRKRTWIGNCPVWRSSPPNAAFGWWKPCRKLARAGMAAATFRNPNVQIIVVERRDRLMRFGFEYVEAALAAQGRRAVVIDAGELADEIVRDLQEVIVSMCARLYGKRSAKNRAKKAIEAMQCKQC